MRRQRPDLHREVLKRGTAAYSRYPTWYAVWLGEPHADGSVLLGRTERLPGSRRWRAYPATGEFPQVLTPWSDAAGWLLEVREGYEKTTDTAMAEEHGVVGISLAHCAVLGSGSPLPAEAGQWLACLPGVDGEFGGELPGG
jgi:hypothetical protein